MCFHPMPNPALIRTRIGAPGAGCVFRPTAVWPKTISTGLSHPSSALSALALDLATKLSETPSQEIFRHVSRFGMIKTTALVALTSVAALAAALAGPSARAETLADVIA